MTFPIALRYIISIPLLVTAAVIDGKEKRIPNCLTFPMMIAGILYSAVFYPHSLISKAAYTAGCLLIAAIPICGMGDIKMMIGAGWLLGPADALYAIAGASILLVLCRFVRAPAATLNQISFGLLFPGKGTRDGKESYAFAPYFLISTLVLEGYAVWRLMSL